jgi:hypothetical protein
MYTCYSCPTPSAAAIAGSASGSAFTTAWQDLFNGRPADATRIQWCSGAQTTASYVQLQFTLSAGIVPGAVGLIGLNILGLADSSGLKVVFTGRRSTDPVGTYPYALGGTSATTRTIKRADGSYAAICVCASGLTPIVGWQMQIYNDQNGAANIAASQFVDLGEAWCSPAFDLDIDADWKLTFAQSKVAQSINNQPWPVLYPPARTLSVTRREVDFNGAFVDGANPCWQSLRTAIGNGQASILIPRWGTAAAPDVAKIHATAVFGIAQFSEFERAPGDLFQLGVTSTEVPALLA